MLLVESRAVYASALSRHLLASEFSVAVTYSWDAALSVLDDVDPDVVVVCAGPHDPGMAILDRVRQSTSAGIVALEDKAIASLLWNVGTEHQRGAENLAKRIRHALRGFGTDGSRVASVDRGYALQRRQIKDLVIDMAARQVHRRGTAVTLTRLEFAVLAALSEYPGEPLTCRHLQIVIWGTSRPGGRSALGVHVSNLRRKLGDDPLMPRYVRTVRGLGYCLVL